MDELLIIDQLSTCFGNTKILKDIHLILHRGEILGIVGESGSGKSTLLKVIMGLLDANGRVTGGQVLAGGEDILKADERTMRQIRGGQIGMIFQDSTSAFCPIRRIGAQVIESMQAHGVKDRNLIKKKSLEIFTKLSLNDGERIWSSYPFELSGGMMQRVCIAVTMLMEPQILLADEPTSALDIYAQKLVLQEMLQLRDAFGVGIMIVTHDIGVVQKTADTVLVMKEGQMVEFGRAKQILSDPQEDYTKELMAAMPKLRRA